MSSATKTKQSSTQTNGGPPVPPEATSNGSGSFEWARKRPVLGIGLGALVGLVIGAGIVGGAGVVPLNDDLETVRGDLEVTQSDLGSTEDELSDAEARADGAESDLASAKAAIARLTREGEVPDFTGRTVRDAEDLARPFDWEISVSKQPSDAPEGTIVSQSITEGTELGRGRSIALAVAVPAPPEWTTFQSFSGSGSTKTDEFSTPSGKVRMLYSMNGGTNQVVDLVKPSNVFGGDLLVNEIGSVSGETRIYVNPGSYYLDIMGGSGWTIDLQVLE